MNVGVQKLVGEIWPTWLTSLCAKLLPVPEQSPPLFGACRERKHKRRSQLQLSSLYFGKKWQDFFTWKFRRQQWNCMSSGEASLLLSSTHLKSLSLWWENRIDADQFREVGAEREVVLLPGFRFHNPLQLVFDLLQWIPLLWGSFQLLWRDCSSEQYTGEDLFKETFVNLIHIGRQGCKCKKLYLNTAEFKVIFHVNIWLISLLVSCFSELLESHFLWIHCRLFYIQITCSQIDNYCQ